MGRFAHFIATLMPHPQPNDQPPEDPPQRQDTPPPEEPQAASVDPPEWHSFIRLGLTERESEVLWWIIEGKRNHEIARILGISPRTIHRHVSSILGKLRVENRAAAIARVLRPNPPPT